MNEKTYSQVLNDVALDGVPSDLNLAPQIIVRVQKGKSATMQLRKRMIVILLVLMMVLMTATAVAATVQHWFGYVPGFGLIRNGQLRELAEPVSISQNGFTLKVEKAILSSEKTLVMYSLEGIPADMQTNTPTCNEVNAEQVMRLPNGHQLEIDGFAISDVYEAEAIFAPIPADVNDATLIINCINNTSLEQVPQHWEAQLHFVAASSALTVVPALEVPPTVVPALEVPSTVGLPLTMTPQSQDGLITLKTIIPIQDGYILSGTMVVTPPAGAKIEIDYSGFLENTTITDASGQVLSASAAPGEFTNSMLQSAKPEDAANYWDCQIHGKNIQWPLTMTIHSLIARDPLLLQAEFQIDVGPNPKVGQVWKLNKDVPLGTKTARIVSVEYIDGMHGLSLSGYEFTLADDPTLDFWLAIKDAPLRLSGGGASNENGTHSLVLAYSEPVPTGVLTVIVSGNELIQLAGPWQVTWQEPVAAGSTSTP